MHNTEQGDIFCLIPSVPMIYLPYGGDIMYAFISGIVHSKTLDDVIVNNGGIGYRIFMPRTDDIKKGQDVFLYTYQQVREDAHLLYGFLTNSEYELFLELIKVKGVGCKTALGMLSGSGVQNIIAAIESSDVAFMKKLPGIGPKTAQQIILDLRGKLVEREVADTPKQSSLLKEVEEALKSLGYKQGEITPVLKQLPKDDSIGLDALIKQALGLMLKRSGG